MLAAEKGELRGDPSPPMRRSQTTKSIVASPSEPRRLSPLPRRANGMPRNLTGQPVRGMRRSGSIRDMDHELKVKQAAHSVNTKPRYLLHPESRFMRSWDIFTALALVFTALVTPYEQAFLEPQLNELWVLNRLIDLTFIADMCIQFLTMHRLSDSGTEIALSQWEHGLRPIAMRYLKGWFAIDMLSLLPCIFDIVALLDGSVTASNAPELKLARVICRAPRLKRLGKMQRLVLGSKLLSKIRTHLSIPHMSMSLVSLVFETIVASHWLACILSLQTLFDEKMNSWYGSYGWCTLDEVGEEQCQPASQMYIVCLNWAFGIVAGFAKSPPEGPYQPPLRLPDEYGGGKRSTAGEMVRELFWLMTSALGRAYITARLVEIFVHANPDWTEFKLQMDELNRYIKFYRLSPEMAQRLREYFYETRITRQAEGRSAIVQQLTTGLQEAVSEQVNEKWLQTVPFFRGLKGPDGKQVVDPVEKSYLAKVAVALQTGVFAPHERPPRGRVYVILQGEARYRGMRRNAGYCWGALDVMLPNAPVSVMDVCRAAVAISYLHVLYVDGPTLNRLAEHFPKSKWAMRKWTIITGMREYLLGELRHASDHTRVEAKNWIKEDDKKKKMASMFKGILQKAVEHAAAEKAAAAPVMAETVPDLHAAMNKRLDAIVAVLEQQSIAAIAQERKMAVIQLALEPLLPSTPASTLNTPYQKSRRHSKERAGRVVSSTDPVSSGFWDTGTRGGNMGLQRKRSASCGNLPIPPNADGMDC